MTDLLGPYLPALVLALASVCFALAEASGEMPWKTNQPIVRVWKQLYMETPVQGNSIGVSQCYVGPGLERMETVSLQVDWDVCQSIRYRFSDDNGRTWSGFYGLPNTLVQYGEMQAAECFGPMLYDAGAKVLIGSFLRQIIHKGTYANFTYYRLSFDHGHTWTPLQQFTYEPGELFDPANPAKDAYIMNNRGYVGNMWIRHSNNTLLFCLTGVNIPEDAPDPDPERRYGTWDIAAGERSIGSLLFIGRWDQAKHDYDWTHSNRVWVPREASCRGLSEGEPVELTDGRVLVVWRGTGTDKTAGRKRFSLSTDGGQTLSEVQEWRYADGSRFYSPASYHRFYRSHRTGKLYWVGNICAEAPNGNRPRYPLVIAEVDESSTALKKHTVTVIDERKPGQPPEIEYSNFCILENRETLDLEMNMSVYAACPGGLTANADRYRITFLEGSN